VSERYPSDVAFTSTVKSIQERKGSRQSYARMEENAGWQTTITPDLAEFLAVRDSIYLATANAEGQPYIQHRGGKVGFVKVLDEKTLGLADFIGNRQYISQGNLIENPKACIFAMDYPNRRRIKIWGTARIVEGDDQLLERLTDQDYKGRPEQAICFDIVAWDINCPQHITPRFTEAEVTELVAPLHARIAELEAQLTRIRNDRT